MSEKLISVLKKKYNPRPLLVYIKSKYCVCDRSNEKKEKSDEMILTFGNDIKSNEEQFNKVIDEIDNLKKCIPEKINLNEQSNKIYMKIIDSCINDFNELRDKLVCLSGEDIAKEMKDIVNRTLVKCFSSKPLQNVLDEHLQKAGFGVVKLEIGHKLRAEDWKYIKDPLKRDVADESDINRILDKTHDAYIFKYYSDDEDEDEDMSYSAIIYGKYEVGVRKHSGDMSRTF